VSMLKDYRDRRNYDPVELNDRVLSVAKQMGADIQEVEKQLSVMAGNYRSMMATRGWKSFDSWMDKFLTDEHQKMINKEITQEEYRGIYRAITTLSCYPEDVINQALNLNGKSTEDEDE
jgi:hypothetical protein